MPNEEDNNPASANDTNLDFFSSDNGSDRPIAQAPRNEYAANPSAASTEIEPNTSSVTGTSFTPVERTQQGIGFESVAPQTDQPATNPEGTPTLATASSFEPATVSAFPASSDGLNVAPKKSKKKFIIAGIVAAIVLVLIAGAAAAYALIYQNENKVLGDALSNALTASTATTDSKLLIQDTNAGSETKYDIGIKTWNDASDAKADIAFSGDTGSLAFKMSGSVVVKDSEKFYVKINKLKALLEQTGLKGFLGSSPSVDSLITKLDSNWVVVTKDEIEEYSGSKDDASTCVENTIKKLRSDDAYSKEVEDLYKKFPLIKVSKKLGSKDGSLGYEIELNRTNAIQFANKLNSTKFYADLKKCDEKIEDLKGEEMFKEDAAEKSDVKVVAWVDRWSHQFTKFEINGTADKSKITMTTLTEFDTPVKVDEPKDAVTIDELKGDIEAIQQEMTNSFEASVEESTRLNEEMNTNGAIRSS